jgi:hypothetical protein
MHKMNQVSFLKVKEEPGDANGFGHRPANKAGAPRYCTPAQPYRADRFVVSDLTPRADGEQTRSVAKIVRFRSALSIKRAARSPSQATLVSWHPTFKSSQRRHAQRQAQGCQRPDFILQCKNLQTCNAKASLCMRLCIARRSHLNRAKFIPQLSVNRRKIISQNPAMTSGLF